MLKKILMIGCAVALTLGGVPLFKVMAQSSTMTDQQMTIVRNNCVSAKNTLNQLHVSDALLRVNIGQTYESMSTKLMDKFNSRVANNSLDNASLLSVSKSYVTDLDTFRSDYKIYEERLSLALNVDCAKQPATFYDAVALAHKERNQVHTDVIKLSQDIDQYYAALELFEKNYQTVTDGVKK